MISANNAAKYKEVSEVAEKDQLSAERKDIHMGSSVQESVGETGNEEDKASDHGNDVVSQEQVMERSFETHNDTGVCNTAMRIIYDYYPLYITSSPVLYIFHFIHRRKRDWK